MVKGLIHRTEVTANLLSYSVYWYNITTNWYSHLWFDPNHSKKFQNPSTVELCSLYMYWQYLLWMTCNFDLMCGLGWIVTDVYIYGSTHSNCWPARIRLYNGIWYYDVSIDSLISLRKIGEQLMYWCTHIEFDTFLNGKNHF